VIKRGSLLYLRWVSLIFISLAIILTVIQLINYSLQRANYPSGMSVAGVPVGGLNPQEAAQRLLQVYASPVEIHYNNAIIHMEPGLVGFELDVESMLAAADLQRVESSFMGGFWNNLWNRSSSTNEVPLVSSISEDRLRAYLQNDIATRYDLTAVPAQLIPGSTEFLPGQAGLTLDINRAVVLIEDALNSATSRTVVLTAQRTTVIRPTLQNLQLLIQSLVDNNGYTGLMVLYLLDLRTGEELHFGYWNGLNVSVRPNEVAFSADSTNKIPILVSVYRKFNSQLDEQTTTFTEEMISTSNNFSSDAVLKIIDEIRGPLVVTENMETLGLQNTCLTAYFTNPIPLDICSTPAFGRFDVNTVPDPFNQTTASDMGSLLADIYQCAEMGGGGLIAAFPGQITQSGCQQMIELLRKDQIGILIQSGVPEGTSVAHKHGWSTNPYTGSNVGASDAAIVYTPGGDYILTIYLFDENYQWDSQISPMFADISRTIYNYFNLESQ